jgi:DNA-damage-inducible protein D
MVNNSVNLYNIIAREMTDITTVKNEPGFEDFSHENGITFWYATEFMTMLGYPTMASFAKPMNRAMQACLVASIDTHDNFVKVNRIVDDVTITDYKLTRFACYMIAMNGDSKKPLVAKSQAYFAQQAEKIHLLLDGANDVERIITREEIKEGHKGLLASAKKSGITTGAQFQLFQDAGYRGLYNRSVKDVKKMKGVNEKHNIMDYMGRTELAANLFRLTLTEEKLNNIKTNPQRANEIHKNIGAQVRQMVVDNTGMAPENLPVERRITEVQKNLKKANKQLNGKKTK